MGKQDIDYVRCSWASSYRPCKHNHNIHSICNELTSMHIGSCSCWACYKGIYRTLKVTAFKIPNFPGLKSLGISQGAGVMKSHGKSSRVTENQANGCYIFDPLCTKTRLAAGLCLTQFWWLASCLPACCASLDNFGYELMTHWVESWHICRLTCLLPCTLAYKSTNFGQTFGLIAWGMSYTWAIRKLLPVNDLWLCNTKMSLAKS